MLLSQSQPQNILPDRRSIYTTLSKRAKAKEIVVDGAKANIETHVHL
jgi:hypothetical protein